MFSLSRRHVMALLLILFTLGLVVAACATPPPPANTPTNPPAPNAPSPIATALEPDRVATRVAEELAVAQTLTAVAKSSETPTPIAAEPTLKSTSTSAPGPKNTPTRAPRPRNSPAPLDFDWKVESAGVNPANPDDWLAIFVVTPRGGNGKYSYFHDGLPVAGPRFPVVWRVCRSKPGSIWVRDGTGQLVTKDYFLAAPYCNVTPTKTPTVTP